MCNSQTKIRSARSFLFVHFASFNSLTVFSSSTALGTSIMRLLREGTVFRWSLYNPIRVVKNQKRLVSAGCKGFEMRLGLTRKGDWDRTKLRWIAHFAQVSAFLPVFLPTIPSLYKQYTSSDHAPRRSIKCMNIVLADMGSGDRSADRGCRELVKRRHFLHGQHMLVTDSLCGE